MRRKTTVYLDEEDAEGLRQVAYSTGKSQAQLIREAVKLVVAQRPKRVFHSMGIGNSRGASAAWNSDELYEKVMGRRWSP